MRILFLTHAFNSLAQRLFVELTRRGHEVSIEFDIHDQVAVEAVGMFAPDLVIAPFLKRAIPASIWSRRPCLVVHPGIPGDRGPSALDWAIQEGEARWGVTVLQAVAEMDAGDVWAAREFEMREARKASVYRNEITAAATSAVLEAVERFAAGERRGRPLDYADPRVRGRARGPMRQSVRAIDWQHDPTERVLRKLRAADSFPGVLDRVLGRECFLYGATAEAHLRGPPGEILATRDGAICRATADGAVWLSHLRERVPGETRFKLPAAVVLGERLAGVEESPLGAFESGPERTLREIRYREAGGVGYLWFDFYNGAMGTAQCRRLLAAYREACRRDTRVLVLMGGTDFWSNGIHLNLIEHAASPADESWRNINAIDDVAKAVLTTGDRLTVAALGGNAGAGGVFLALAADLVIARRGVVLNPHYKGMGNLYGSEYWTYSLPRRCGEAAAAAITGNRLPVGDREALEAGLIDELIEATAPGWERAVAARAEALAAAADWNRRVAAKRERRRGDEAVKPLARYREEELERMRLNFYGFDPSYHVARYNFVHKRARAWTPLYLARHRASAARARGEAHGAGGAVTGTGR